MSDLITVEDQLAALQAENASLKEALRKPTDAMVRAAHKALMSELFGACQPNRGDVFGFMDDRPELLRPVIRALSLSQQDNKAKEDSHGQD